MKGPAPHQGELGYILSIIFSKPKYMPHSVFFMILNFACALTPAYSHSDLRLEWLEAKKHTMVVTYQHNHGNIFAPPQQ